MKGILLSGGISAIFAFLATPLLIKILVNKGYGQIIRDDGPTSHHVKRGTPTMGGLAIIAAMLSGYFSSHLITGISTTISALLVIGLVVGLGFVGFIDDWLKVAKQRSLGLNAKQKSRYSVKVAYDYIYTLPENDLVYILEDDYLHYPDSIQKMLEAWAVISKYIPHSDIGIFPQDFNQLYPHPKNHHNDTYVRPCYVIPGPDRYYRTTWYTHESFMVPVKVILKYKEHFDSLLMIGNDPAFWEGNTISNVWTQPDVMMLMPLKTLAIHVSAMDDIPFYNNDFVGLWEQNKIS